MIRNQLLKKPIYPYNEWEIIEENFNIQNNYRNETIFFVGNGYLGFRGNFEEGLCELKGNGLNGTYINGFYDTEVIKYGEIGYAFPEKGQTMLNVTNSKIIKLFIEDEEFDMQRGKLEEYKRVLSLQEGVLSRRLIWCSPKGKKVKICTHRIVSLENKHQAVISYEVTPLNFSGNIRLVSELDGNVTNITVENDPRVGSGIKGRVLSVQKKQLEIDGGLIVQKTKNSALSLACAMSNLLETKNKYTIKPIEEEMAIKTEFIIEAEVHQSIKLNKFISYITSLDCVQDKFEETIRDLICDARLCGFEGIKKKQLEYLEDFWSRTDIEIKGDLALQQGIRLNIFHLLQSVGRDGERNISAKGLSGEGYEGHYFWDTETYILPFFLYNNPQISRKLLEFRYSKLDKARERARQMTHTKGALFPWRGINGEECSAYYPAGTAQYHIDADIAFAIKRYMEATEDTEFLIEYGAELLFETARLWADLGSFIPNKGNKFCINSVTGPDEYSAVVNNNCYTNLMAKVNLEYAYDVTLWMENKFPLEFGRLAAEIGLEKSEIVFWKIAADRMYVPYDEKLGIYLQDDSFLDRAPWDFENTPEENYPLLLHYHPLVIYRHQVCKQADLVLALLFLGDMFTKDEKRRNFDFYEKFTTHDSSLSTAIFSIIACEIGYFEKAYQYFMSTARMDLDDYHGNTKDGIHAANMAGTWMCVVNGFAGMRAYEDGLYFNSYLPEEWEGYSFKVTYKGRLIKVEVDKSGVKFELLEGNEIEITSKEKKISLRQMKLRTEQKSTVKAIIFDLDGVIVSTDECHYEGWKRLADQEGIYFDKVINERLRGVSRMESLEIILERTEKKYTTEQKLEMATRKNEYYKELIKRLTPEDILPGVSKLLAELKESRMKIAIGSSSKNSPLILKCIGLDNYFDATADGNDISRSKPDPEVFLVAAKKLNVLPENCMVVEDADAGIEAALAAGMKVLGVGFASGNGRATIRAKDLATICLEDVLKR